jgi:hypothetical protein
MEAAASRGYHVPARKFDTPEAGVERVAAKVPGTSVVGALTPRWFPAPANLRPHRAAIILPAPSSAGPSRRPLPSSRWPVNLSSHEVKPEDDGLLRAIHGLPRAVR